MKHSDGGLTLSYNAQISTDAAQGLIVGVAVTQEANDSAQLIPAVERLEQRLKKKPQQMVADGGYTTRDNIEKMAGREIDFLGSMGWEEHAERSHHSEPASAERVRLISRRRIGMFARRASCCGYEGRHDEEARSDLLIVMRRSGGIAKLVSASRSAVQKIRSEAARWLAGKKARRCRHFGRRWPARKRKRNIVAGEESWSFATRGSKASWVCDSFMCADLAKVQRRLLWACLTYNLQQWIRLSRLRAAPAAS